MLILTRNAGEAVMIGDDVCVTVLWVKGDQVRLGIKAPDNVRVLRDELLDEQPTDDGSRLSPPGR
jgi:carbon storage regulator